MEEGDTCEIRPGFVKTLRKKGTGQLPCEGMLCEVHYVGRLDDGSVFDSSHGRRPLKFHLGMCEVIKGWDMGVSTMTVGERSVLRIPYLYAYGDHGSGPIPPKADLTFEMELLAARDDTCDSLKRQLGGVAVFVLVVFLLSQYVRPYP